MWLVDHAYEKHGVTYATPGFFFLMYTKQLQMHTKCQCHAVSCTSVLVISFVFCFLCSVRGVGIFFIDNRMPDHRECAIAEL